MKIQVNDFRRFGFFIFLQNHPQIKYIVYVFVTNTDWSIYGSRSRVNTLIFFSHTLPAYNGSKSCCIRNFRHYRNIYTKHNWKKINIFCILSFFQFLLSDTGPSTGGHCKSDSGFLTSRSTTYDLTEMCAVYPNSIKKNKLSPNLKCH